MPADQRREALERQDHASAIVVIPGDVADVAVALGREYLRRDHVRDAAGLDQVAVGSIEPHEQAVEEERLVRLRRDTLEVLERDVRMTGLDPAAGIGGGCGAGAGGGDDRGADCSEQAKLEGTASVHPSTSSVAAFWVG